MRTTRLVWLAAPVILLASGDVFSTETDFNRAITHRIAFNDHLVDRSLSSGNPHRQSRRLLRANSKETNADSEERMITAINGALGKVGSVVETGGAKVAPKLEKYQQWLKDNLTPSQVRVGVLKNEPWQKIHSILQGKDSDQYLKFIVDHKRQQPGSTISKPASSMENFELWLYAGLTPSQVRVDILKTEPQKLQTLLQGQDSNQYLKFLIDYKRLQPGSNIPKSASSMKKYELWLYAGLTPSQVREAILKNAPLEKILQSKDSYHYLKFLIDYKRLETGRNIPKSASNMELSELWLFAGLTPSQVRIDVLKNMPVRKHIMYQYLEFLVDYKRLQPGNTIPKSAANMDLSELWLYAGLTPSEVRREILKSVPLENILQSPESHQYLKFEVDYKRLQPGSNIPKSASSMEKFELWRYSDLSPAGVRMDILKSESQNIEKILQGEDAYQYLKFIVDYKRQRGSDIPKPASSMENFELWLYGGLTPSDVKVAFLKQKAGMDILEFKKDKDVREFTDFMTGYERLHPNADILSFR
ncbi:RxLR effector protein [Phytophthora megakarya]|uniref:RxLR effector protein n=1 Tax=Phytophthora megakarya TaxID=4795 RepID=A0A225V436_9STRA|nr:RxLR effector protein [Phytophthora megakarya]